MSAPTFRSPPRIDAPRTLRRHRRGVTVAIAIRGRSAAEIARDIVDGIDAACGPLDDDVLGELRAAVTAPISTTGADPT